MTFLLVDVACATIASSRPGSRGNAIPNLCAHLDRSAGLISRISSRNLKVVLGKNVLLLTIAKVVAIEPRMAGQFARRAQYRFLWVRSWWAPQRHAIVLLMLWRV